MGKRFGDRRDGELIRNVDSMHIIMPLMYPNRCDNEAYIGEIIDLTNVNAYLEKKNTDNPAYPYKLFQVMVTAMLKAITLRPEMNRFIANKNLYQRNHVSAAFTVKKIFKDGGDEALAKINAKPTDTIDTIHDEIFRQVSYVRKDDNKDQSTQSMDMLQKLPRPLLKMVGAGARFLDRHGWMPASVVATDPYQSSVVLSNIGSLKMNCGYHHLTNWGTTSVFCLIGQIREKPFIEKDGSTTFRQTVQIGLTIDERIADGYYYSKTIRLVKKLLENPELLERPLSEEVPLG
ncbi:MAG: 2-oxo acid dehydrogenase subunit E2 [Lachnospiraceae bacterium]|nr:2-oxo acid dehydrogenase subunit E2 [Lachnospiraceae bacterium]